MVRAGINPKAIFIFCVSILLIQCNEIAQGPVYVEPVNQGEFYCSVEDTVFGIDVSHHNGVIDWEKLKREHPEVEFAYIRCTVGPNSVDRHYKRNVQGAQNVGIKTGAYVYYWANWNSSEQFKNFKTHVLMAEHELIPVLDIEKSSKHGEVNLRRGLANWMDLVEKEYNIKPALYTNLGYYNKYLSGYFNDCPKWIAAYSRCPSMVDWDIHQYSDKGNLRGISGNVDLNYAERENFNLWIK